MASPLQDGGCVETFAISDSYILVDLAASFCSSSQGQAGDLWVYFGFVEFLPRGFFQASGIVDLLFSNFWSQFYARFVNPFFQVELQYLSVSLAADFQHRTVTGTHVELGVP